MRCKLGNHLRNSESSTERDSLLPSLSLSSYADPPSYSLSISDISASLSSKYGTFRSIPTCLMTSSRGMYWVAIFSWQELKPLGNFVQGSEKIHSFQTEIHSD